MDRRRWLAAGAATLLGAPALRAANPDDEVVLGQSGVLSGVLGAPVQALRLGAMAAFDAQNAAGGVNGRRIKLVSLDDELQPPKAVANYKALLDEHKAFAFFGCVGSGTTAAAADVLHGSGTVAVGGYAVADSARKRAGPAAFFVRASTEREAEVLVRHLTTIGSTRIAVAHLANPGGEEALALVRKALQAQKLEPAAAAGIGADGAGLAEATAKLGAAQPHAVIMYLAGRLPADLMTAMRKAGSRPRFYGMSIVSGEATAKVLGEDARGLAIAQVMPFPWRASSTEMQAYQDAMAKAKAPLGYTSLEGWIDALVVIEALRRSGRDLTRDKFRAALQGMKTRIAGLDVDFTGGGLAGSRFVELVQVRADGGFVR